MVKTIGGAIAAGFTLVVGGAVAGLGTASPAEAQETLRVGTWAMPGGRGNPYTARGTPSIFVWTAMFDKLTAIDKTGAVVPEFAQQWQNVNPTTWRFTIPANAKFSNGEVLDAASVKATFDWLQSEAGRASPVGQWVADLDKINVIDATTFEMVTKTPNPIWPKRLAVVMFVPPKAWADMGVANFAAAPIGSGAFKMTRLAPESASLEAFDGSWKKRANISKIEMVALSEAAARNQALLSGQIDVDTDVSVDNFTALKAAGFTVDSVSAVNTHGITFNQVKEGSPWRDKRLRQAANYAVDKESIVKNVYGGLGAPASQHATPISFGYNKDLKPYPFDQAKAKQLLTEAGFPNGVDLVIEGVQVGVTLSNMYQAVAQQLNAVGIRAKVQIVPVNEYIQHFLSGNFPPEVHAFGTGSDHAGHLDAGVGFSSFYSCAKRGPIYCVEEEMPLINAAATEFDVEKRRKLLSDVLAMNRENASLIFVAEQTNNMAYSAKVKNFKNNAFVLNYHEMRVER